MEKTEMNRSTTPEHPTAEMNCIPAHVKNIHLTAVCGTGMGALACMLKEMGYAVTGSDHEVYPPMSDFLREKGIHIISGFHADNLTPPPDLVVIGNAVTRGNPESIAMARQNLPYCSMPQALNHFAVGGKQSLLVTGTHGKTTTSALLAWVLYAAGLDPTFMIGGILRNFNSNYRLGQGDYAVIEGDEYDTAFFDKGPKFLHYTPKITILTSVEFDHADIFKDFEHVRQTFRTFIKRVTKDRFIVACHDDPVVRELMPDCSGGVISYGLHEDARWRLHNIVSAPPWSHFEVLKESAVFGRFKVRLAGMHNLSNSLAVIAAADTLNIPVDKIGNALEHFESVKRRQEIRGVERGITVMDDFAHHPTAVRETIKALKPFYPDGRLIAVFEPRTNSSMRKIFQDIYPKSFELADMVCIRNPSKIEKIPPDERFSSRKLVADLVSNGKAAYYFDDTAAIINHVVENARSGDLVLIMSNGGFDNIHDRLIAALHK